MLIFLILRGVSFEFRMKATGWHRELWNRLFFVGSLGASIAQGFMLGGLVTGFESGPAYLLFDLLVGVGLAGGYALLGATWLVIKAEGDLQARALRWTHLALLLTVAGVAAISLATPFASSEVFERWFAWPNIVVLAPLPVATTAAFIAIWKSVGRLQRRESRREWPPFVLAVWVFVFAFAGLAYSMFPYLIFNRMTIWQAAAAHAELLTVFAAGWNPEFDHSIECGHRDFRSQHGFPWRDFQIMKHIRAVGAEIRVGGVADAQVKIPRFSSTAARFALAGDADAFAIGDAGRDAHLEGMAFHSARFGIGHL